MWPDTFSGRQLLISIKPEIPFSEKSAIHWKLVNDVSWPYYVVQIA